MAPGGIHRRQRAAHPARHPHLPLFLIPLAIYLLALWISAIISTRSLKIGSLAVAASMVQLLGYGSGFIRAYVWKILLRHGRDEAQEIAMRKGK